MFTYRSAFSILKKKPMSYFATFYLFLHFLTDHTVTFQSTEPFATFQEIIVQARPIVGAVEPVGTFSFVNGQPITNDANFRIYNCPIGVQGSTVGTATTFPKGLPLTFTYMAPNPIVGNLQFV